MVHAFAKIRAYGNGRKMVELPKTDANYFAVGDLVMIKKVDHRVVESA